MYLIIGHIECNSVECNSAEWNSVNHNSAEEKNGRKYLVFYPTDQHKEVLKKNSELWDGIKNETETINDGKKGEYGKDFMKIKFDTDDNLPLNKPLKLNLLTTIVRFVLKKTKTVCMNYVSQAAYKC